MEDTDNRIISRLVDAARNRIWFDRLFRWPALALWISASLLIVAGLVHRFFHEMPATIVWISALAPVTLAGLAALPMARPRIREAAVAADRWSGAQSLLLAAWETGRQPPTSRPEFAPLAVWRATQNAAEWMIQIKNHPLAGVPGHTIVALAVTLAGSLLLVSPQPSVSSSARVSGEIPTTEPATEPATAPPALAEALRALGARKPPPPSQESGDSAYSSSAESERSRESLSMSSEDKPSPEGDAQRKTASSGELWQPVDSHNTPPSDTDFKPEDTEGGTSPQVSGGSGNGGGDIAGRGEGRNRLQSPAAKSNLTQVTVAIARTATENTHPGDHLRGEEFTPGTAIAAPVLNPRPVGAARLAPAISAANRFSPAERQIIARYLQTLSPGEPQ